MDYTSIFSIMFFSMFNNIYIYIPMFINIIMNLVGFKYFHFDSSFSSNETDNLLKYISKNSYYFSKSYNENIIIPYRTIFFNYNPFLIGYINCSYYDKESRYFIDIYSFVNIETIIYDNDIDNKQNIVIKKNINVFEPVGNACWKMSIKRTGRYEEPKFIPHKKIIKNVIEMYKKNIENSLLKKGYLGCLFYGNAGTGKSSLGLNIALELDCDIITNYDPTISGLSIRKFLIKNNYNNMNPLVIVINEFDKIVSKCFKEEVEIKSDFLRDAWSKSSLNNLIDFLSMHGGIILICTSNENLDYYYNSFESVVREGRFNYKRIIDKLDDEEIKELEALNYCCSNGYLSNIKYNLKND